MDDSQRVNEQRIMLHLDSVQLKPLSLFCIPVFDWSHAAQLLASRCLISRIQKQSITPKQEVSASLSFKLEQFYKWKYIWIIKPAEVTEDWMTYSFCFLAQISGQKNSNDNFCLIIRKVVKKVRTCFTPLKKQYQFCFKFYKNIFIGSRSQT